MAKKVSDIEDGFALKRRRENAGRDEAEGQGGVYDSADSGKSILSSFTLSNPASKRAITDYVETQARDEKVLHAERSILSMWSGAITTIGMCTLTIWLASRVPWGHPQFILPCKMLIL